MAIWFEVEKSEIGLKTFLDCNWGFHDFRLEKAEYISQKGMAEIFLKYDTDDEGVLLRFVGVHGIHINAEHIDYDTDWLNGCVAFVLDNNAVIWLDDNEWGDKSREHLDELKEYTDWVEAERIFWAVSDADGNPIDIPQNRVEQVWDVFGKKETKHFNLKEFDGNWDRL